MEAELFFVAFYKHGAPQLPLFDGPFLEEEAARIRIAKGKSPNRCVVKCTIILEEVPE